MARILLLMSTRTYKAEALLGAAARLHLEVVAVSDQAAALTHLNPEGNLALPFDAPSVALREVRRFVSTSVDAVLAADDDGTILAATLGNALGVPHNPVEAVRVTSDKLATRLALRAAGLPTPRLWTAALDEPARDLATRVEYPCVLKPRHLSGSQGVIRANDETGFERAHARLVAILSAVGTSPPDLERERPEHDILVERFVPGREVALEGVLEKGRFRPLALFDKPDPLDGPFFEETIYVTPSRQARGLQRDVLATARRAIRAFGLRHGPVHVELRANGDGAWLLEAAPRSIGGLCSRVLTFGDGTVPLEEVLIRNALGEGTRTFRRRRGASGVMMIPIPGAGILSSVSGVEAARAVPGVQEIRITAAPGSRVAPPPEGARYLGFIFARAKDAAEAEQALRDSHAKLHIRIEPKAQHRVATASAKPANTGA